MNKVQEDGGLAAYLQLGADRPDGHHTSHFTFDESVLPRGLELLARLAVAALARRPDCARATGQAHERSFPILPR